MLDSRRAFARKAGGRGAGTQAGDGAGAEASNAFNFFETFFAPNFWGRIALLQHPIAIHNNEISIAQHFMLKADSRAEGRGQRARVL
jgi:hypothetical protein